MSKCKPEDSKVVQVSPPENQPGKLKRVGGSMNDAFNNIVANQTLSSLWVAHSDEAGRQSQYEAASLRLSV